MATNEPTFRVEITWYANVGARDSLRRITMLTRDRAGHLTVTDWNDKTDTYQSRDITLVQFSEWHSFAVWQHHKITYTVCDSLLNEMQRVTVQH